MHRNVLLLPLIVGALVSTLTLPAQSKTEDRVKVKARMALEHKPDGTMMPYSIIRSSPTAIMVFRSPDFDQRAFTKRSPRLDVYESEKLTYMRGLEPLLERSGHERLLLEDLILFGGKPTMIARTGGQEEIALYYQNVDPHLTRPPPAFDRICAFPVEVKKRQALYARAGNATRERWSTVMADDGGHLLIHSPELRNADDGDAMYLLAMVDKNMHVQWQQILHVDGGSERSEVLDAAVDSTGTAYVLIKYRYKDGAPGGGAPDYEVVLHRIDADDMSRMPFGMDGGYYPTGGILQPMAKGRIAFAGIYATAEGNRKLGNFISYVDTSEAGISTPQVMPFTDGVDLEAEEVTGVDDSKKEEEPKEDKKSQKRLHSTTDVIALLPGPDGGLFFVNEIGFAAVYTNPETARRYQRFYHGPIQARLIDKNGELKWTTLFRRWTTSDDPLMGPALSTVFNDQLYIFLWDSDDNVEQRKAGGKILAKQGSGSYTAYVYFDEKGAYRTKPVLRNDSKSGMICGWTLVNTGKDEYMTMGTESLNTVDYYPVRIDFIKETKK
ncbi:MAG: hypothetical protein IPI81_08650 [Flavobacteriales bacterium]|nr:hypothetical protein [Flavobacteriales bacterium]MCC6938935.1 hypothetical protein [Flavobacteriales bacterium]